MKSIPLIEIFDSTTLDAQSSIIRHTTVGRSAIHGSGLFAAQSIKRGQVVMSLGGRIFALEDVKAGRARFDSVTGFDEGLYIGHPPLLAGQQTPLDEFLNHSCDPNLWLFGRNRLVARRQINIGDELTVDYSTWEIDNDWRLAAPCNCRSTECRGEVRGTDWRIPALQIKYAGHLLPCLEARIRNVSPNQSARNHIVHCMDPNAEH